MAEDMNIESCTPRE